MDRDSSTSNPNGEIGMELVETRTALQGEAGMRMEGKTTRVGNAYRGGCYDGIWVVLTEAAFQKKLSTFPNFRWIKRSFYVVQLASNSKLWILKFSIALRRFEIPKLGTFFPSPTTFLLSNFKNFEIFCFRLERPNKIQNALGCLAVCRHVLLS